MSSASDLSAAGTLPQKGLAAAAAVGSKVDDLDPVHLLGVGDRYLSIASPDVILSGALGSGDLRLKIGAICRRKAAAQCAVVLVPSDPLSDEQELHLPAQLTARFPNAPHEPSWVTMPGLAGLPGPLRDLAPWDPILCPVGLGVEEQDVSLGLSGTSVLSFGNGSRGMLAPWRNSFSASLRIAGLISVTWSSEARRSLTTFFSLGW